MEKAIRNVRAAAILIGPRGLGRWQDLELEALVRECVKRRLPVIPVLLPGQKTIPRHLAFLQGFTQVRFDKTVDDPGALDSLQWGIVGEKPAQLVT
jgi:hypothetical protein